MGRYSLSVAFGAALLLAGLAAPARANMVVLECVFGTSADQPQMHHLLEIDYAANTVRSHYVDDDGAPYTLNGHGMGDSTNPAQITDNTIAWTEPVVRGNAYEKLGRYSGELTTAVVDDDGRRMNFGQTCHPWTPPQRQRQF